MVKSDARFFYVFLAVILSFLLFPAVEEQPVFGAPPLAAPVNLTILHVSDFHGYFHSYKNAAGDYVGGYARLKAYRDRLESEGRKVLLLCSGDTIQGSMAFRFFGGFPDIEMMNLTGFAAMAVGNHEFDGRMDTFAQAFKHAEFPLLAANLHFPAAHPGAALVKPYIILDLPIGSITLNLALVGLTDEMLLDTMPQDFLPGLRVDDGFLTLRRVLPQVWQEKPHAVLVLSHLGWPRDVGLAQEFPELCGILGGHTHLFIDPPLVRETAYGHQLLSQPGEYGQMVTRYDLRFTPAPASASVDLASGARPSLRRGSYVRGAGSARMEVLAASLVPMAANLPEDSELKARASQHIQETQKIGSEIIGEALVHLDGSRSTVRKQETNLGNLIADSMIHVFPADLAIVNGGGIRGSIHRGPITLGTCLDVLPFENHLVRLQMTGDSLQKLLVQIADSVRFYPGYGGFPHINSGANLQIGPHGTTLTLNGQPLNPERTYAVTTLDFLACGGNGMTAFSRALASETSDVLLADALIKNIKDLGKVSAKLEGRLQIDRSARKSAATRKLKQHPTIWGKCLQGFGWREHAQNLLQAIRKMSVLTAAPKALVADGLVGIPFETLSVPAVCD